jgi:hypothetical protein
MERYQGIVPLDGNSLANAAHNYFRQSEQIPTALKLAAGPLIGRGREAKENWRAGAIMIQHLPREGGSSPMQMSSGDAPEGSEEKIVENDCSIRLRIMSCSIRPFRRNGCCTACFMKMASPFIPPWNSPAIVPARASVSKRSRNNFPKMT